MTSGSLEDEIARIRAAYNRRQTIYDPVEPWILFSRQERERAIAHWIRHDMSGRVRDLRLVELGCGSGGNLADLLRLGFTPSNLCGVELLEERINIAKKFLPREVRLLEGEATSIPLPDESFDVVFQSLVCSSVLDHSLVERMAARMWDLVRPGGGVLWYDFIYDNPSNPDVRGLPLKHVERLFPVRPEWARKLTLAPPISRRVTRLHPSLYTTFNVLSFLRTHLLCWFRKHE